MDEKILLSVQKPARYINHEINSIKKSINKDKIRIALCFPDTYEIGMSHLGIRILYELLNSQKDVYCERVFCPWLDMEEKMRQNSIPLSSLETDTPLSDFDIVGFSLCYELNFTNVLNMLDLGNIPLKSVERDSNCPLVIAGGPCSVNPEPLASFIDVFIIGEAEELILGVVRIYKKFKSNKEELLLELAKLEGIYIPGFYRPIYYKDGNLKTFHLKYKNIPARIKKRYIKNFEDAFSPTNFPIPYIQIVHDRIDLEIMRGCPHHCRFCQARNIYFPNRMKTSQKIISLAKKLITNTGYEEIALTSLSSGDYAYIEEVINELYKSFNDKAVAISLSSLRAGRFLRIFPKICNKIKKSSITFAPEAATGRLRKIINKNLNEEELIKCIKLAFKNGNRRKIKLYFMIGLPTERIEDIDAISKFTYRLFKKVKKDISKKIEIVLSISNFIPKPHTPFQWFGLDRIDNLKQKMKRINNSLKVRNIKANFHNPYQSYIEAILSRGDRKISELIFKAWQKKARFDAWSGCFNFEVWDEVLKDSNIEPEFYTGSKDLNQSLPWEHIDIGVTKESLKREYLKALEESN